MKLRGGSRRSTHYTPSCQRNCTVRPPLLRPLSRKGPNLFSCCLCRTPNPNTLLGPANEGDWHKTWRYNLSNHMIFMSPSLASSTTVCIPMVWSNTWAPRRDAGEACLQPQRMPMVGAWRRPSTVPWHLTKAHPRLAYLSHPTHAATPPAVPSACDRNAMVTATHENNTSQPPRTHMCK